MIEKKLVDYVVIDQDTNLKFAIDVEGYKYLLPPDAAMPDVPSITLSGLVVTISGIDIFNDVTVSGVYVTVSGVSENFEYEEIYIQGYNTANFPNTNGYYPIPNMSYTVQTDEILHITSLTAASTHNGVTSLGFYINGVREREIPMYQDVHITFPKPHKYYEGETIQLRVKPSNKNARIQAFIDGYITEE